MQIRLIGEGGPVGEQTEQEEGEEFEGVRNRSGRGHINLCEEKERT